MESRVIGSTRDLLDMLESIFEEMDELREERDELDKECEELEGDVLVLRDRIRELEKERVVS